MVTFWCGRPRVQTAATFLRFLGAVRRFLGAVWFLRAAAAAAATFLRGCVAWAPSHRVRPLHSLHFTALFRQYYVDLIILFVVSFCLVGFFS